MGSIDAATPSRAVGAQLQAVSAYPLARADRPVSFTLAVLASSVCYYVATQVAWALCFPDSKVSLFFPPHAVLVAILLLAPTRHWWAYTIGAAAAHYVATQQAGWPVTFALNAEVFDAAQNLLVAGGIRALIASPFHRLTLRDAIVFVLVAVVVVPFGTAPWGAAFTIAYGFGTEFWIEARNLGVSQSVTAVVLVPAILLGVQALRERDGTASPRRIAEAGLLTVATFAVAYAVFDRLPAGPGTSAALLYAPVPLLVWAALRFGLGGMSASMLVITMMAIWGTMQGRGPFLEQAPAENALALQSFLLVLATPLLLLAVAIAEERRSQEALRVSDERIRLAAESAQLVVWDWDTTSDLVWLTEDGRQFLALDAPQPIDHATLAGRVHPEDRDMRAKAVERALTTGSYEAEFRLLMPDGAVRWVAARGRRHPGSGSGASRVVGVALDITAQKTAAAAAQAQQEELAHLSRVAVVSTLSGSLAHELSQPLGSILNNAQAGRRMLDHESPDVAEIRSIFDDIVADDRRAGAIIRRLQTMLRRGHVAPQPVAVNECIEEMLSLARVDLIARGISVANLAREDLPPAMTDRVQLLQVLLNLTVNACDAMKDNPAAERVLTFTSGLDRNELRIGVLDLGPGLPDDAESLFQPFHSTKEGGLGMGLSISRTLVGAHGGRLWAERRPERGAAFYVTLPVARGAIDPAAHATAARDVDRDALAP